MTNKLTYSFPVQVINDTGWKYSSIARPNRGLHDYERLITFERPLTKNEEDKLKVFMYNFDNPGYCGWKFLKSSERTYALATTWDSSD